MHWWTQEPLIHLFQYHSLRGNETESRPIDGRMVVSVPNGDNMISERIVLGSRLVIQNRDFPADLIVLGIHDFDIILSMDWLSRHRATLDCYKKEVRLVRPEELGVIFRGIKREIAPSLINAMTTSKMLWKGCQGYLAFVVDRRQEGTRLEDIPIVRDSRDRADIHSSIQNGASKVERIEGTIGGIIKQGLHPT